MSSGVNCRESSEVKDMNVYLIDLEYAVRITVIRRIIDMSLFSRENLNLSNIYNSVVTK